MCLNNSKNEFKYIKDSVTIVLATAWLALPLLGIQWVLKFPELEPNCPINIAAAESAHSN